MENSVGEALVIIGGFMAIVAIYALTMFLTFGVWAFGAFYLLGFLECN
jgi:hypothetical protein